MPIHADYKFDKPTLTSYKVQESEKKIIDLWAQYDAKPHTEEQYYYEERKEAVTFAWGPPFPTGAPHSGHILNAVLKDIFLRYSHQKYLKVESKFFWDCHGIPVEHEVDKKLGIKCPNDVQRMGIAIYNAECRKFVLRHEADWKNIFKRVGVRVDFSDACTAMTAESMERVWGAFKRLYNKGLVYRDTKVLPFSTGCFTHLSDFEAEQKWGEVTELGATIALVVVDSKEKLLIWIDGPWRLVAATAVCVKPSARYVKVKVLSSGSVYILSKSRLGFVFPNPSEFIALVEFEGKMLQGLHCLGLEEYSQENEVRLSVLADESVSDDVGTGIVALAPHFGEEDYRICKEHGVQEYVCSVDESGRFKDDVPELGGMSIFEASTAIVDLLRRRESLVYVESIKHKRRCCWRSDTPLIDKLVSSWFLRIKDLNEQILENSAKVNWVYNHGQGVRETLHDWAVGRSRYWGTPIPIWSSPSGDEVVCVGSIDELLKLTGLTSIPDLHREFVDNLEIKSKVPGNPPLRRVSEVFDCWFEASIVPRQDDHQFDAVIEGSDQFDGWFYTTYALSAALAQPPLSKNILVHGLVQTPKGEKMSKRRHNHTDPVHIIDKYGADAFRLYLLTTPLVSGHNFILQEQDVPKNASRILPRLYELLKDILPRFGKAGCVTYGIINSDSKSNTFDSWILSRTERLIQFYDAEMAAFRVQNLVPKIIEHLEVLLDVYMPIRRGKFKDRHEDRVTFSLYGVFFKLIVMLSPFAPFFTEHVFQIVKPWVGYYRRDLMYRTPLIEKAPALIAQQAEDKVDCWRMVVDMVRELRRVYVIPVQYRISELILVSPTEICFRYDVLLNETLLDVLNVHRVSTTRERSEFGVGLEAGLRGDSSLCESLSYVELRKVAATIEGLNEYEIEDLVRNKSFTVDEEVIHLENICIICTTTKELGRNQAIRSQKDVAVIIRMNKDFDYYEEGTRLELVNSVMKFRKKCKVYPSEEATVWYSTKDGCIRYAFEKFADHLKTSTNSIVKPLGDERKSEEGTTQMGVDIKGVMVTLSLCKETVCSKDL